MKTLSMKHNGRWIGLVTLAAMLVLQPIRANSAEVAAKAQTPVPASSPGMVLAKNISLITGVAISPLLGAGAVGAYEYLHAPKDAKGNLPWFANPLFWVPALLMVTLTALKDTGGIVLPPGMKKPFDIMETFENKISGLVATGAFVPIVMGLFGKFGASPGAALDPSMSAMGYAAMDAGGILNILLTPFAMLAFVFVWLSAHAINVLILISPFATVDAGLKVLRTFLLSLVTGTSFVNPYFGAAFALAVILVSYFLAGWALRLTVFGTVFSWDFISRKKNGYKIATEPGCIFLSSETEKVPIRTMGSLKTSGSGKLIFTYRPWLFLKARPLELAPGNYAVGKGLFYGEILRRDGEEKESTLFLLPPRYNSHEQELATVLGFKEVVEVGILKRLTTTGDFFKSLLGLGSKKANA